MFSLGVYNGTTPLMNAADEGRAGVVKLLLMAENNDGGGGARVKFRNDDVRNFSCAGIMK